MRRYSYNITINGNNYDVTPIADSSTLSVVSPLCSQDKKSGNGTASVNLKGGANPSFYRTFMGVLLAAQQSKVLGNCLITIHDHVLNKIIHRGWLNNDELSISSAFFPDALNLASRDKMRLLDTKIKFNHIWENKSRNQIVKDLLSDLQTQTGITVTYLSTELTDSDVIGHFAVTEGSEKTYREIIDKLLFEAVGYVIWYDPDADGFRIKRIPTDYDSEQEYRVVTYRVENRLVTQSSVYENDGILLTYPTITERPNTNVFNEGLNVEIDDDGTVKGEEIESGDYFPVDGDVKEIYQEYSVPDRAYLSGESRLQTEGLKLLYAKDVSYQLASSPQLSLADAIPSVNWSGEAEFYPDRARILFKNKNTQKSNVTTFSLTGTAVYVSALNRITVPSVCAKPEEYSVETITDNAKAKAFADWYYNSRRYGCTTSKWCEPEGYSTLGEIVLVRHKDTGVEMPHVVVQITDSCAGGKSGTIRLKEIVAISLYGWQEVLTQTPPRVNTPSVQKIENARWYSGTVLTGQTTARGVAGNYGDFYLNTETGDIYKCITTGTANTALWQWIMNNKGKDADISNIQQEIEYGLSESDEEFIFPVFNWGYTGGEYGYDEDAEFGFRDVGGWSDNYDNWYKGLYVWQRIKTTDEDGNVTYGEPIYCKTLTESLIQSCSLSIEMNPINFTVNPRRVDYQYLPLRFISIGYMGTLEIETDTGVFSTFNPITETYTDHGNVISGISITNPKSIGDYYLKLPYTLAETQTVTLIATLLEWDMLEVHIQELVLSGTKAKTAVVQLATVSTEADLPTHLNITDSQQQDISTGNNLIYGDYIIVEHQGSVYRPTPYMWNGSNWVNGTDDNDIKSYVKVNTVNEVVRLAKIAHDSDPTVDYHDVLYAYSAYIENLTVGILNVGNIFANDIESNNYSESEDGIPLTGYRLEHDGGDNGDGQIKSVGGLFKDINVSGNLDLRKSNISDGANILHPSLTTKDGVKGDPTGRTLGAFTHWSFRSLYDALGNKVNSILSASGTALSRSVSKVVKLTNAYAQAYPQVVHSTIELGNGTSGNFLTTTHKGTVSVTGYQPIRREDIYSGLYNAASITFTDSNGNVLGYVAGKNRIGNSKPHFSIILNINNNNGTTIHVEVSTLSGYGNTQNGSMTPVEDAVSFYNAGMADTGLYLYYPSYNDWFLMNFEYTYNASTFSYNLTIDEVTYASQAELAVMSPFTSYTSYVDSESVTHNLIVGNTYALNNAPNIIYKGNYLKGVFFRLNGTDNATLILSDGTSLSFTNSSYLPMQGTIKIADSEEGVEMKGQYPVRDAHDSQGGFDVGMPSKIWDNGYFRRVISESVLIGTANLNYSDSADYQGSIPLANGLIVKYGVCGRTSTGSMSRIYSVNFTNAFPNNCFAIFTNIAFPALGNWNTPPLGTGFTVFPYNVNRSQFNISCGWGDGGMDGCDRPFYWVAIGY